MAVMQVDTQDLGQPLGNLGACGSHGRSDKNGQPELGILGQGKSRERGSRRACYCSDIVRQAWTSVASFDKSPPTRTRRLGYIDPASGVAFQRTEALWMARRGSAEKPQIGRGLASALGFVAPD